MMTNDQHEFRVDFTLVPGDEHGEVIDGTSVSVTLTPVGVSLIRTGVGEDGYKVVQAEFFLRLPARTADLINAIALIDRIPVRR